MQQRPYYSKQRLIGCYSALSHVLHDLTASFDSITSTLNDYVVAAESADLDATLLKHAQSAVRELLETNQSENHLKIRKYILHTVTSFHRSYIEDVFQNENISKNVDDLLILQNNIRHFLESNGPLTEDIVKQLKSYIKEAADHGLPTTLLTTTLDDLQQHFTLSASNHSAEQSLKREMMASMNAFFKQYIYPIINSYALEPNQIIENLTRSLTAEEQDLVLNQPQKVLTQPQSVSEDATSLYCLLYAVDGSINKQDAWNHACHTAYFFISLPADILYFIFTHLELVDIAHLRLVSRRWSTNTFFTDYLNIQDKAIHLLDLVLKADEIAIEKYLKQISYRVQTSAVILMPVSGTEPCGRMWQSVSPLSFAAWIGDIAILNLLLAHLPATANKKALMQLTQVKEQGLEHGKHMAPFHELVEGMRSYIAYYSTKSWDDCTTFILHHINPLQFKLSCFGLQWICEEINNDEKFDRAPQRQILVRKFEVLSFSGCLYYPKSPVVWDPFQDDQFKQGQVAIAEGRLVMDSRWCFGLSDCREKLEKIIAASAQKLDCHIEALSQKLAAEQALMLAQQPLKQPPLLIMGNIKKKKSTFLVTGIGKIKKKEPSPYNAARTKNETPR